ncbi:MAG: hypothetical protein ABJL57_03995 [Hyphomonas sp.]|uniref:hypothetical protein n=1 Tax=Hyphomonas sp. TaxID=87 RepID=UPI003299CDA2
MGPPPFCLGIADLILLDKCLDGGEHIFAQARRQAVLLAFRMGVRFEVIDLFKIDLASLAQYSLKRIQSVLSDGQLFSQGQARSVKHVHAGRLKETDAIVFMF